MLVNWHEGNIASMNAVATELQDRYDAVLVAAQACYVAQRLYADDGGELTHGGGIETLAVLAHDPSLVKVERAGEPTRPPGAHEMDAMRRSHEVYGYVTDVTELAVDGWYGNPAWATAGARRGLRRHRRPTASSSSSAASSPRGSSDHARPNEHPALTPAPPDPGEPHAGQSSPRPVGLGRWARVLANGAQRGDTVELFSCFSRDEERRAKFAEEYGIGKQASSYEELLADPEVEGVIVTTPNDTHLDVIGAGARGGQGRLHRQADRPHARGRQPDRGRGRGDRPGVLRRATARAACPGTAR